MIILLLNRPCYVAFEGFRKHFHHNNELQEPIYLQRDFPPIPLLMCFRNRLFTACKRSLGQGNVFTSVCHYVHISITGDMTRAASGGGGVLHLGVSASRGWSASRRVGQILHWILWDTVYKRVVCILLECILVSKQIWDRCAITDTSLLVFALKPAITFGSSTSA